MPNFIDGCSDNGFNGNFHDEFPSRRRQYNGKRCAEYGPMLSLSLSTPSYRYPLSFGALRLTRLLVTNNVQIQDIFTIHEKYLAALRGI